MAERLRDGTSLRVDHLDFPRLDVGVGWCVDPAPRGRSSIVWNEPHSVCLVFFGEEFSFPTAGARHFTGSCNEHHVLRLYALHGDDFVSHLNGYFCGLLIDEAAEKALLFNDRFGLSRIYYHESGEGLWFSSEAKALLTVLPKLRQIDQRGLAEFFSVGCVLQNRSIFKDVSLLPPGSLWTLRRGGRVQKQQYVDRAALEQLEPLSPADYSERLPEIFSRIVPRYAHDHQGVAMSLTGGLDSRMILASLTAAPGSLPCYTFGGPFRDCADVRIARKLAAASGQPHTTIGIDGDFLKDFPTLAEKTVWLSDGTMDVSGAVELYVNRRARAIAPIRLTGNYGSEVLRLNVAFRPRSFDTSLFTPEFQQHIASAVETYHNEAAGHRLSFISFKQVPWHHHARFSIERSQLIPRSPFLDNELVTLAYQTPHSLTFSASPALELIARGRPALALIGTDRALRAGNISFWEKLAHKWQEFTAKAEYAYDYGMPHRLARVDQAFKPLHFERLFLGRHKFYHFRVWYRDQLSTALMTLFNSAGQPSCYIEGSGTRLIQEHMSGRFNHTVEIHKLLTVQLIERLFVAPPCHN